MLGDWDRPYLTMDFKTEANIIRALGKIISNGHLLKGAKPVHWCTDCGSSLAEAEVEYYDKTSPSIDVSFHAADAAAVAAKFGVKPLNGTISVIWTTTPWTLPANRAISLHPDFTYQLVQVDGQCLIGGRAGRKRDETRRHHRMDGAGRLQRRRSGAAALQTPVHGLRRAGDPRRARDVGRRYRCGAHRAGPRRTTS